MQAHEILQKYLSFFEKRGHKVIPNAPLVLQNDPTTLFTSSGMQPLVPYLLGEVHPDGTRLVNVQNCIRTQDIEEVGDNRHTTFFRMLGNWSLGDYFKKEEIPWFWEFLTQELLLPKEKLYITVFKGIGDIPKDEEAVRIWTDVLSQDGLKPDERIFYYSDKSNWWSRSGTPDKMPPGEPGGPSTEIFYEFSHIKHDTKFGDECHPNCDCGRFMEIGNSVFMQYIKAHDGSFKPLPKKNIDFGGGLERIAAAVNDDADVFTTDLYTTIIAEIEKAANTTYEGDAKKAIRVIADHMKAATYLMLDGVEPSNKEQGYVLRRLLRRSAVKLYQLHGSLAPVSVFENIITKGVLPTEQKVNSKIDISKDTKRILPIIREEMEKFSKTLDRGLKILEKAESVDSKLAFDLYQSYGFPFEITEELMGQKGVHLDKKAFDAEFTKHQDSSRSASAGKFRGGLADHSEKTIMGHTATHLMHQALRDVLGNHVHQTGSNITSERIRFDFNYDQRLSDEQIKQVEDAVNAKIKENLPVHFELIDTDKAHKMGAIGLFMDTYGEKSKIYFIGGEDPYDEKKHNAYSIEFCGGPHVNFTGELKSFKIIKQENLGKNQKRLYSIVGE